MQGNEKSCMRGEILSPLVSVIITTYKRSDYLKRAIRSVLNQTYRNIELLIVDDNDSDTEYSRQVRKIVEAMGLHDGRIVYIPMGKNAGACEARNRGFRESHGEYVDFLDDDDEFHKEKIALQVKKFSSCDAKTGMIGCFAEIKDETGAVVQYDRNKIRGDVFFANLCRSICQTSLPLIKREVFEKSGGFEKIVSCQEHLMLARVLDVCPYYDYVAKELATIYHHSGERISNGKKKPQGAIELAERFQRYYHKLDDGQISKVELAMNANIINSFVFAGDRRNAYRYYKKRRKMRKGFTVDDGKLLFGILFGSEAKKKIHRIFK